MARSAALNPASMPFFPGGMQQQITQQRNTEDRDDGGMSPASGGVGNGGSFNAGASATQFASNAQGQSQAPYSSSSFQQGTGFSQVPTHNLHLFTGAMNLGLRGDNQQQQQQQQRDDRRSISSHSISATSDYRSIASSPSPPLPQAQAQQQHSSSSPSNSNTINNNTSSNSGTISVNTSQPPSGAASPQQQHPPPPHSQHQIKLMMSLVEGRSQMSPSPRDRDGSVSSAISSAGSSTHSFNLAQQQRQSPSVNGPQARQSPSLTAPQQRQSPTMRHQSPVVGDPGQKSFNTGLGEIGPLTRMREPSMLSTSSLGTLPEGENEQFNQSPSPPGDDDAQDEDELGSAGSRSGFHTPGSSFYTQSGRQNSQLQLQQQLQQQERLHQAHEYYLQQQQQQQQYGNESGLTIHPGRNSLGQRSMTSSSLANYNLVQTPTNATSSASQQQQQHMSSSPVSSQDSVSVHSRGTSSSVDRDRSTSYSSSSVDPLSSAPHAMDRSFEEQLRNSIQFRAMLDRLGRVEYATREIQRDLGDLNKKVNVLVERALAGVSPLGGGAGMGMGVNGGQPEFKDPFASNSAISSQHQQQLQQLGGLGHNRSPHGPGSNNPSPASLAPLQPRPSIGNIAPNQPIPPNATSHGAGDDISTISARLNTLTSSVGQLLALQTQQMQQNVGGGLGTGLSGLPEPLSRNNSIVALNTELAPNQMMPGGSGGERSGSVSVHGLAGRPDMGMRGSVGPGGAPGVGVGLPGGAGGGVRAPNPPMRTWSAGNLDLPTLRANDQAMRQEALLRDKRRSVSGLLRRDSAGVIDPSGDNWGGRDGPVISKWEQLALSPELLRSLGKFGVGPPNKIQQRALPFLLKGADIIAQAPPTQERIAAYVIPAIQVAVTHMGTRPNRGPLVIMVSTTVDQATQAQRMIRDLGGPIGVRSALGVGISTAGSDLAQELRLLQQNMPHIICGTPQKLHALFTSPGGLIGSEVRFLVLDEVDQLIARNLHEFVFNIVKLLPPPRSRPLSTTTTPNVTSPQQPPLPNQQNGNSQMQFTSPFEPGNPVISPFTVNNGQNQGGRRFSAAVPSPNSTDVTTPTAATSSNGNSANANGAIERQTALFSNTVPQDVLNLANAIQLREPVRVLVRRDGNVSNPETSQGTRGLRQFYLYLAFTAGSRSDPLAATAGGGGLGIIGSGRGATSAETTQAREWKLDALADMFEDLEVSQAIVHVGGMTSLDSVVYKLASRGLEAIPLHGDMNAVTKVAALNKFRTPSSSILRQASAKVLVIYDVQLKNNEVPHVPLVLNYDLPKAVEEYAHRVSPAIASNYSRAGVVVNFVTATGGDVEMLRSIECFYKIKCPEVPINLRDIV